MNEFCVCSHPKDRHKMVVRARDGKELYCGHCEDCDYGPPVHGCHRYRPCLNWPDSEGWWHVADEIVDGLCHAKMIDGDYQVAVCLIDTFRDYRGRNSHNLICPQFVKQLEGNPFADYVR